MAGNKRVAHEEKQNLLQEADQKEPLTAYTKGQILASAKFQGRKDLVSALLTDGENYTINDVEEKIKEFMKGKVK